MNTVLVTGATGNVGRHVVRLLHDAGTTVHCLVRDAGAATTLLGPGPELAVGDLDDEGSVRAALEAVDRVFLASGNDPRQVERETACIDAAAHAGVGHVVKLSAFGAEVGSPVPFLDGHARIEERLRASGPAHHVLRPTFLMSNLLASLGSVLATGHLFLPAGGARVAMVDPRDVAEVAAVLLSGEESTAAEALWLTGPQALTFDDVAADLSSVLGRPVTYVPVPDAAAREQLLAGGASPWLADGVLTQFTLLRAGAQREVTDAVHQLTGRPPRPVGQFLREVASRGTGSAVHTLAGA